MSEEPALGIVVGGQAVLEGVMMRAPWAYCVCVRKPDGELVCKEKSTHGKSPKIPFVRGVIILFSALIIGLKALNFSAEVLEEKEKPISPLAIAVTMIISLGVGALLFLVLPLFLTQLLALKSGLLFNIVDGVLRLVIFLAYLLIISLMKDIRRVFQYHGAEHKVVYTYEAGEELTIENARPKSTLHPRCGTSFLLFVVVISVAVFAFIPHTAPFGIKLAGRIILVPLIAGISYELIRLSHRYRGHAWAELLMKPGLLLQKITTKEPDDEMLDVAIHSMKQVLSLKAELPGVL